MVILLHPTVHRCSVLCLLQNKINKKEKGKQLQTYLQDMVWHHYTQHIATNSKGAQLTP